VQVDPISTTLKAPGTEGLNLKDEEVLSSFAFKFNLRRCIKGVSWNRILGRAVQVDPIKTTLKAPRTKRLKLKCDEPLSYFAFNFNLRCYSSENGRSNARGNTLDATPRRRLRCGQGLAFVHFSAQPEPFLTQNTP